MRHRAVRVVWWSASAICRRRGNRALFPGARLESLASRLLRRSATAHPGDQRRGCLAGRRRSRSGKRLDHLLENAERPAEDTSLRHRHSAGRRRLPVRRVCRRPRPTFQRRKRLRELPRFSRNHNFRHDPILALAHGMSDGLEWAVFLGAIE